MAHRRRRGVHDRETRLSAVRAAPDALFHAACLIHDSPDIVSLLLRRGANPFKRMPGFPHKPAAHQAAGFGHVGVIDALYAHSPKLLQQKDWFGFTFTMACAFAHDMKDTAAHVLSTASLREVAEQEVSEIGMSLTALVMEEVGNLDTLKALLEAGANPDRDEKRESPFSALALMMSAMQVYDRFGGKNQMTLEAAYIWGSPALHTAACRGHLGAIDMLIEHRADVNRRSPAYSKHTAAPSGVEGTLDLLLAAARGGRIAGPAGRTPNWAERTEQQELAKMLRENEAPCST